MGGSTVGQDVLTEVVELATTDFTPLFGQIPFRREAAVGALFGNTPIICGGIDWLFRPYNSCISFHNSQWNISHSINGYMKSTGIQINSTTLWILGGGNFLYQAQDSTQFIIQGQTSGVPGPKLPDKHMAGCGVKYSEEAIFLIGGGKSPFVYTRDVWIFNPQNGFSKHQGPSLNQGRRHHVCKTMSDGEKTLIIVAGGSNLWADINGNSLDSVEIYNPIDNTWNSGKRKKLFHYLFSIQKESKLTTRKKMTTEKIQKSFKNHSIIHATNFRF